MPTLTAPTSDLAVLARQVPAGAYLQGDFLRDEDGLLHSRPCVLAAGYPGTVRLTVAAAGRYQQCDCVTAAEVDGLEMLAVAAVVRQSDGRLAAALAMDAAAQLTGPLPPATRTWFDRRRDAAWQAVRPDDRDLTIAAVVLLLYHPDATGRGTLRWLARLAAGADADRLVDEDIDGAAAVQLAARFRDAGGLADGDRAVVTEPAGAGLCRRLLVDPDDWGTALTVWLRTRTVLAVDGDRQLVAAPAGLAWAGRHLAAIGGPGPVPPDGDAATVLSLWQAGGAYRDLTVACQAARRLRTA